MNQTGPSRYQVRVISPRLEPPNPALTFEMAEADVSMRLGDKELDWAPLAEVQIDRIDSETFSIRLRSTEWEVRPLDVAGFLFGSRERLDAAGEPKQKVKSRREPSAIRPIAWAVLHGLLALSILGVGVVVGRYSLDGSNLLSGIVAMMVIGVGLLWSRIVPGRLPAAPHRKVPAVRPVSRPATGVRLSGDVDILKDILGDRVQAGPPIDRTPPRPPVIEDAPWLQDVELPTLDQGADDLTVIRGIGPAVSSRLAGAGVVTYKQIAHLSDEEFEKLGRVLGPVLYRVDLDAWHRDAKMAYEHKYGQKLDSAADLAGVPANAAPVTDALPPSDNGPAPESSTSDGEPLPEVPKSNLARPAEPATPEASSHTGDAPVEETEVEETGTSSEESLPADPFAAEPREVPTPVGPPAGELEVDQAKAGEVDPDELGFILTDLEQIESAWKEIDESVLMLDPDEPSGASGWTDAGPTSDNGHEDDLTVIRGIGTKTARKLADIGIVSLHQIAEADAEQIGHMEAALGFRPGRFSSEGWQELARIALTSRND